MRCRILGVFRFAVRLHPLSSPAPRKTRSLRRGGRRVFPFARFRGIAGAGASERLFISYGI